MPSMNLQNRFSRFFGLALLIFSIVTALPTAGFSQTPQRQMALTFDDLPLGGPGLPLPQIEVMTDQILSQLSRIQAPSVGLVNEEKLIVPGEIDARTRILSKWSEAGAELGNHTFSHPDLNRVSPTEFIEDILRGETITRVLLAARGRELTYFRHPYLHTGLRHQDRDQVESFLARRGYQIAPVTMENSDWIFNVALLEAERRSDRMLADRVITAYLDYTGKMIEFIEKASVRVVGRSIPQVMLLHANPLNARSLGRLLDQIAARGYRFISLEQALADAVYSRSDNYLGPAGVNWIFRWDVADGSRDVDWRSEPQPPGFVDQLYQSFTP